MINEIKLMTEWKEWVRLEKLFACCLCLQQVRVEGHITPPYQPRAGNSACKQVFKTMAGRELLIFF